MRRENKAKKQMISFLMTFCIVIGMLSTAAPVTKGETVTKKLVVYVAASGMKTPAQAVTGEAVSVTIGKTPVLIDEGKTAADAVRMVLENSEYKDNFVMTESSYGAFLEAIGDVDTPADYSKYWSFCVNDQEASVGMSSYELKDQDEISLLYSGYPVEKTQCDCYVDDETKNPSVASQAAILEDGKMQQIALADAIYKSQFENGKVIPGLADADGNKLYTVFSLAQAEYKAEPFYSAVAQKIAEQIKTSQVYGTKLEVSASIYAKAILCLSSLGIDVTNIEGTNLVEKMCSKEVFDKTPAYTTSREAMVLLALDSKNYEIKTGEGFITREQLVKALVEDVDNMLDISIAWESPDSAAMVIQALAPYMESSEEVKTACQKVFGYLEHMQNVDGTYIAYGASNPWTLGQVMATAGAFGKNVLKETDCDFIKNGVTLLDVSGTFVNTKKNTIDSNLLGYDPAQLLRGINACVRVAENKTKIFDTTKPETVITLKSVTIQPTAKPTTQPTAKPSKTTPTVKQKLKRPVIKKVVSKKKKTLTITFGKVKNAKKYVVEVSTNKKFKKNVIKKITKKTKITFKKLKSKKRYYVRVRAISKDVKSKYSVKKSKKVK